MKTRYSLRCFPVTGVMRVLITFTTRLAWLVGLLCSGALVLGSETYYVATNGPGGDARSWATATNNIQDAISLCVAGDLVLVSNGVYETGGVTNWPGGTVLTNRVAITNAITVRSANNDPTNTIIKGRWDPDTTNGPAAVRCVYMDTGSSLIGFMLTNGATLNTAVDGEKNGGGVYGKQWRNGVISNCVKCYVPRNIVVTGDIL